MDVQLRADHRILRDAASTRAEKVLNPEAVTGHLPLDATQPVLVLLAAGRGTRFGENPKCIQPVCGLPLARHTIQAFKSVFGSMALCVVGYRQDEIMRALGDDLIFIRSENPVGGTAFAAYEALSLSLLDEVDALLLIGMGDRIVTPGILRSLIERHFAAPREADLTFLTARYSIPNNHGKGRILRDAEGMVLGIIEQQDIDATPDVKLRSTLNGLTEGNCPLYAIRASRLRRHAHDISSNNAQGQFYLTDLIGHVRGSGGLIRTISISPEDFEYRLLCADLTRPSDLPSLEEAVRSSAIPENPPGSTVAAAAQAFRKGRPAGQVESIAAQFEELWKAAEGAHLGFAADKPVALGVSGGRFRIAFMHPDMGRFYGPAWQTPIGAKNEAGREQVVIAVQESDDRRIHLYPTNEEFREKLDSIASDDASMYPGEEIIDWYSYESFGTQLAENLLLSLGYFTDDEINRRRELGKPLPPPSLWVSTSMRRPFSLIGNAIASLRTVRTGEMGTRIQAVLGRDHFRGLRIIATGNIPRGGFSSSSAVTVATKNALNALFDLGISSDMLVHLSCQAEYGTGVRAGSLDQATEQKGIAGQGTLISSNPRDSYRILGTFPVPASRFRVIFPYTVDRDRAAWQWSAGSYSAAPIPGGQTTAEMRKITGKAAELAAFLVQLPLEKDFFKPLERELIETGTLSPGLLRSVYQLLLELPLLISKEDLLTKISSTREWFSSRLAELEKIPTKAADEKTDATIQSLFAGWRDPVLVRKLSNGKLARETGVPLRAMVAYLFGEVAKNFYLIHHTDEWIEWVTRSQRGDRCFEIDPHLLPAHEEMMAELPWEAGCAGPARLNRWLEETGAAPFDYDRGLDDASLSVPDPPGLHLMEGSNFFRGLALIDLAEAMLKRAFGAQNLAVRVNAAGQGDFFQVHIDTARVSVEKVKEFIQKAFYRRFGLEPALPFVETHPGGGATGARLERFDQLPELIRILRKR